MKSVLISSVVGAALCGLVGTSGHAWAQVAVPQARIELPQTGESARTDNPDCKAADQFMTAGDLVLKVGAAAIDAYVGYPVATPLLEKADRGQIDWLKGRMGLHDGRSTCVTQCVIIPASVTNYSVQACISETGGDGLECSSTAKSFQWARVENFTTKLTDSGRSRVACVTVKNWSHNRNRWFTVQAGPSSNVASTVDSMTSSSVRPAAGGNTSEREPRGGDR